MCSQKMYTQADFEARKQRAKATSIESYLASKGFYSHGINNARTRTGYKHNPIDETKTKGTPNFSIYHNTGGEIFKDHKSGATGDIIKLAEILNNCEYKEAVTDILGTDFSAVASVARCVSSPKSEGVTNPLKFLYEMPIKSDIIIEYIRDVRCLNIDIALKYTKTVNYSYYGQKRFGIGWKNDSGGYMVRSTLVDAKKPYVLIDKEDVTTLKKDFLATKEVVVFESMIDFLSLETALLRAKKSLDTVVIILNSTSNVGKLDLSNYNKVYLALNNDKAGQNAVKYIKEKYGSRQISKMNRLYKGCNDINEALVKGKLNM